MFAISLYSQSLYAKARDGGGGGGRKEV